MDRYNKANGVDVAPAEPAASDHPYYTSGDPENDIPATTPGPWFFHMIIESMRNVILAAGLVPSHNTLTLFRDAILSLITGGSIQGSFKNLAGSAPGTSAVVTYTIDEIVTGDGMGNYLVTRNWNSTINMATIGAGGLDAGVVAASTWYYAYAITKDDGTKSLIASLSPINPTLPATYTKYAGIGSFYTDGTANKYPFSFKQIGREIQYKIIAGSNTANMRIMASGTAGNPSTPTWVAVATGSFAPPRATKIKISVAFNTASSSQIGMVAPNNNYGAFANAANPPPIAFAGSASTGGAAYQTAEFLLETSNIYWASSHTTTSVLSCLGYTDNF